MEVYDTEREQIEAIKKWWKENGKSVVIGTVLGVATLIGWQQWQANIKAQRETASMEYDVMLAELEKENFQGVKERGARIVTDYDSTPYAALAALVLAKVNVEEQNFAAAKTYLQIAIDQDDQPQLQQVARLRLGRLLLAEGQADQALSLIKGMQAGGFEATYHELEGDIHVVLGNHDLARDAYQRALDNIEQGMDSTVLQMKLDDVGGSSEAHS